MTTTTPSITDLRIPATWLRRVARGANSTDVPPALRQRLEETATWLDLEVDRARPEGLVGREVGDGA